MIKIEREHIVIQKFFPLARISIDAVMLTEQNRQCSLAANILALLLWRSLESEKDFSHP